MNLTVFALSAAATALVVAPLGAMVVTRQAVEAATARFEKAVAAKGQAVSGPPTHRSRSVVAPNPDLLFGVCVYDTAKGDTAVRLDPLDGYWSVSLFDAQADNFHVTNRRNWAGGPLVLRITDKDGAQATAQGQERRVVSPTRKGVVLLRVLPRDPADPSPERERLKSFRCQSGDLG